MKSTLKGVALLVLLTSLMAMAQSDSNAAGGQGGKSLWRPELSKMYTEFTLTSDLSHLSAGQRQMVKLLIEAAQVMDDIFWTQSFGDKQALLSSIADPEQRRFAVINYGPWNRLDDNAPFLPGFGPKPEGAGFYPADITREEIEKSADASLRGQYTLVRRREDRSLYSIPYHEAYKDQLSKVVAKLREAAALAEDAGFKNYLELRAKALLDDDYLASDNAWMDMKNNAVDLVIGPIENYEDALFNYKSAHSAYVLIKDRAWSERLARYAALLPELQRGLPVDDRYKQESPGTDSDLNAYDVVFYAGDSNAGSKTIAINLPNDERVQLSKGTRRLQLKNAMKAKFDKIMVPIAAQLIDPEQRKHVTFDAFFANTMFHEVAHGLGIKNTVNGKGTVRLALKERSSALEEGKADILGLYMISSLLKKGEMQGSIEDYYTTFIAGIFRSVRFGAASAHGQANMLRFNFFKEQGAFERRADGTYHVNYDKVEAAMTALTQKIIGIQAEGDYDGLGAWMAAQGKIDPSLQADLDRLAKADIPTDVVFNQGWEQLAK